MTTVFTFYWIFLKAAPASTQVSYRYSLINASYLYDTIGWMSFNKLKAKSVISLDT